MLRAVLCQTFTSHPLGVCAPAQQQVLSFSQQDSEQPQLCNPTSLQVLSGGPLSMSLWHQHFQRTPFLFSVSSLRSHCRFCRLLVLAFRTSPTPSLHFLLLPQRDLALLFFPVPYFRHSHGCSFYYVLMTHRCTVIPLTVCFIQTIICLSAAVFLFGFSMRSNNISSPKTPYGAS